MASSKTADAQISMRAMFVLIACLSAYFGGPHYVPVLFGEGVLARLVVFLLIATIPIPLGICCKTLSHPVPTFAIGLLVIYGQYRLLLTLA